MQRRLQTDVVEAAALCGGGCNPMWWRLQPYVVAAATLRLVALGQADHLHAGGQPSRALQRRRRERVARLGASCVRRGVNLHGVRVRG